MTAHQSTGVAVIRATQDEQTRAYYEQLAQDKAASTRFLQDAGILDERGELAAPFREAYERTPGLPEAYWRAMKALGEEV